jgi:hypothetical protein
MARKGWGRRAVPPKPPVFIEDKAMAETSFFLTSDLPPRAEYRQSVEGAPLRESRFRVSGPKGGG